MTAGIPDDPEACGVLARPSVAGTWPREKPSGESEWKILAAKFNKTSNYKLKEQPLEQSVRWIARLGGFIARKDDNQPGISHFYRGMKINAAMLEGATLTKVIYG